MHFNNAFFPARIVMHMLNRQWRACFSDLEDGAGMALSLTGKRLSMGEHMTGPAGIKGGEARSRVGKDDFVRLGFDHHKRVGQGVDH